MLKAVLADITALHTDAVVNAANSSLSPGSGVCGAIHRAAGSGLSADCSGLGGCPTGEARITAGYHLPAKFIIHTVGPVWQGGGMQEEKLLESCYRECLKLAELNGLSSISIPCISTGIFGFPRERAAATAVSTVKDFAPVFDVIFCCFTEDDLATYNRLLENE